MSAGAIPNTVLFRIALRKAIRKNAPEESVDYLNITAMLDMMTIVLVFLLKSAMASTAAPPQSDELRLPGSVLIGQPREDGIAVFVSKTQILVGDDPTPVVTLPSRGAMAQSGADAKDKGGDPSSLRIVPLAQSLAVVQRTDQAIRVADHRGGKSQALLIADASTPFRLIAEVLYTLGQAEFGSFHLMVLSGGRAP